MSIESVRRTIRERLAGLDGVDDPTLEAGEIGEGAERGERRIGDLAAQLLWRIGRTSDDAPVTVRVGFASSAALFDEMPRLRGISDADLEAAVADGSLRVEWVGYRPE